MPSNIIISAMAPGTGVLFDLTPRLEQEVRRSLSQVRRGKKVKGGRLVVGVAVPVGRPMLLSWHPQAGRLVSGGVSVSAGNPEVPEWNSVFLVGRHL